MGNFLPLWNDPKVSLETFANPTCSQDKEVHLTFHQEKSIKILNKADKRCPTFYFCFPFLLWFRCDGSDKNNDIHSMTFCWPQHRVRWKLTHFVDFLSELTFELKCEFSSSCQYYPTLQTTVFIFFFFHLIVFFFPTNIEITNEWWKRNLSKSLRLCKNLPEKQTAACTVTWQAWPLPI